MLRHIRILFTTTAFLILYSTLCWGLSMHIDRTLYEDDGLVVNRDGLLGTADFNVLSGNILQITLANVSLAGAVTEGATSSRLTGIGFDLLSGWTFGGGSVVLATGSTLYDGKTPVNVGDALTYKEGKTTSTETFTGDVSKEWGFLSSGISGHYNDAGTQTDSQISTMTADVATPFALGTLDKTPGIAGPQWGLISTAYDPGIVGGYKIQDAVVITANLLADDSLFDQTLDTQAEISAFLTGINAGEVVLTFGSPESAPVPEPATLLLLGSGLAGIAYAGRKKTS